MLNRILKKYFSFKRDKLRSKYERVLPANELFTDRWEKARYLGFGKNTSIYDSACVFGDVTVGENTWIGPFTVLDGSGGLTIGNNCSISAGVQIYTHDTVQWAISGGIASYEYAPVTIGDNCYIGPNTIIAKGTVIGKGAVVGANSYVKQTVPEGGRVAGNPARTIAS